MIILNHFFTQHLNENITNVHNQNTSKRTKKYFSKNILSKCYNMLYTFHTIILQLNIFAYATFEQTFPRFLIPLIFLYYNNIHILLSM
jgi:hypothetical protein